MDEKQVLIFEAKIDVIGSLNHVYLILFQSLSVKRMLHTFKKSVSIGLIYVRGLRLLSASVKSHIPQRKLQLNDPTS